MMKNQYIKVCVSLSLLTSVLFGPVGLTAAGNQTIKQGDIWIGKLPGMERERAMLICSCNERNLDQSDAQVLACPLSSLRWADLDEFDPEAVGIYMSAENQMNEVDSNQYYTAWTNQPRPIPKENLLAKKGHIDENIMSSIHTGLSSSLNIGKGTVDLGHYRRGAVHTVLFPEWMGGLHPGVILGKTIVKGKEHLIIGPMTSKTNFSHLPSNVFVSASKSGLNKDSMICLKNVITIKTALVGKKIGQIQADKLKKVDRALKSGMDIRS